MFTTYQEELGSWNGIQLTEASFKPGGAPLVSELDLGGFDVTANMGRLARLFRCMTQLCVLKLNGNPHLEGRLQDVSDMSNLQVLNLSGTKIGGTLEGLLDFTKLTELVLDNTFVEGDLVDLKDCNRIKVLSLFKAKV